MKRLVFEMIQHGQAAELAAQLANHAQLAETQNDDGISALRAAVYHHQPAIRDLLLPYLPELDIFDASAVGDTGRIEQLLFFDPSLVATHSTDGWTPLHLAAAFAAEDTVRLLLERGADAHARSHNDLANQPLHACIAMQGSVASARDLVEYGADVNATQAGGITPLHLAAAQGKPLMVELLIEQGALPTAQTDDGKLPVDLARERGHTRIAERLAALTVTH
ncbi:MAG: ankyrin repeat domain-containing protein [Acidobacteriaceae bacterium]